MLPLTEFSTTVQDRTKSRLDDSVAWLKCQTRGFLLSDALLQAVRKALEKRNLSIEDIDTVDSITADISIKTKDGASRDMSIVCRRVEMKKR